MTIPTGVASIGDSAFHDCNGLTSLTISEPDPASTRAVTVGREEGRRYLRLTFALSP